MPFIRYESGDGIGTITIDRPEKRNAMTFAMLRELRDAIGDATDDSTAKAVILTGVPGAFCAGTDLSDLQDTPEEERGGRGFGPGDAPSVPFPLLSLPKPVVAAIDGPAVGMGAEFTSMCDVRIATTRARFAWNFVHRGLVPDTGAGTWLLPRILGVQTAARLLYSGEFITGEDAARIGYVAQVVEPDELAEAARREAARFTKGSPFAIQRVKDLMYAGLSRTMEEHLTEHRRVMQECFSSEDHREGVASFLERREPNFTGR